MKLAIIIVPLAIPVNDSEEAEKFCSELDKTVKLNFLSELDRQGVELDSPEPLNSMVLGYINPWRDGDAGS